MCLYGDRQQGEIRRCVIIQRAAGQLKLSWGRSGMFYGLGWHGSGCDWLVGLFQWAVSSGKLHV